MADLGSTGNDTRQHNGAPRSVLLDFIAVTTIALAAVLFVDHLYPMRSPEVIYVSPNGSDWNSGGSPTAPLRTVGEAARRVRPGTVVEILPGTYRETVRVRKGGEKSRPVVFRATVPGTVSITGAARPALLGELAWRDDGGGMHSAIAPWRVHRIDSRLGTLFHPRWSTVDELKVLVSRSGAMAAFVQDPQTMKLHLYLPGGLLPREAKLTTHGPIPSPREWGNIRNANAWVEANYVVFEGLHFEMGVGAGLLLWRGAHVTVRDCLFNGAELGITAQPRVAPADHLVVEHSLYHNYPQRDWLAGWLDWREIYASYASSTLLQHDGYGVRVTGNVVVHAGDALRLSPRGAPGHAGAVVENNLLAMGTDDALEAEGPAEGILFRRNLVYDFHQNLGLSPVETGPVHVTENLFLHPFDGVNGSQVKLIDTRDGLYGSIRNVTLESNVFIGNWLAWSRPTGSVENVVVRDNLFAIRNKTEPPWPAGLQDIRNIYVELSDGGYPEPGNPTWWRALEKPESVEASMPWSIESPGPRWLDLRTSPESRELMARISGEFFVAINQYEGSPRVESNSVRARRQ